jgi:DnaK suppressor protein
MTPTKKTPNAAATRTASKSVAKTVAVAQASPAKKAVVTKKADPTVKKPTVAAKKTTSPKGTTARVRAAAPPAKKAAASPTTAGPYASDAKFLGEQTRLLDADRAIYQGQAIDLKAEADSLAQEREPGDVQFDEESGEGGTVTVDRERDLALSAQALLAVEEIDDALVRIAKRTYGACERCRQAIPKPRLKALPYARLCVACKSGGLSRR